MVLCLISKLSIARFVRFDHVGIIDVVGKSVKELSEGISENVW